MPISAILFGGSARHQRAAGQRVAVPGSTGVFIRATIASEQTAAAEGTVGALRRDPFAMLPFCGYNMANYWGHWLKVGQATSPGEAAQGVPGQLVPQGRRRQVHLARVR